MTQPPSQRELTTLCMSVFQFNWDDRTYNRQGVLSPRQQQDRAALGQATRMPTGSMKSAAT